MKEGGEEGGSDDEGWREMKDESQGSHLRGRCAMRSEGKLVTPVQIGDDG